MEYLQYVGTAPRIFTKAWPGPKMIITTTWSSFSLSLKYTALGPIWYLQCVGPSPKRYIHNIYKMLRQLHKHVHNIFAQFHHNRKVLWPGCCHIIFKTYGPNSHLFCTIDCFNFRIDSQNFHNKLTMSWHRSRNTWIPYWPSFPSNMSTCIQFFLAFTTYRSHFHVRCNIYTT